MFSKETFCSIPWSTAEINPDGRYKVCAFTGAGSDENPNFYKDKTGRQINVLTHSIMEGMNTNLHKQIRIAQSKNERHPSCKVCWERDDACKDNEESNSYRYKNTFKKLIKEEGAITIDNAASLLNLDGSISNEPIMLDLRFTNICNMKCIMCSSIYSSLWVEDEIKLYGAPKTFNIEPEPWHDSPIWWDKFNEIKHRVKRIYVTGGEPFIVKGHDTLLDNLIESGLAPNITMEYDSNLSVINNKLLNKLKQFKGVDLSVSCDDVGEQYDFIRFNGKFDTILKNLMTLKENKIKIRNLSSCVGIYSIYSPIRVYNYFTDIGYDNFNRVGYDDYSFRFLRHPVHVDLMYLPDHIKDRVINIYKESNLPEKWKSYFVNYLIKYKGKFTEEQSMSKLNEFKNFMDKMDAIRNTDWKKTFPEIVDLLNDTIKL